MAVINPKTDIGLYETDVRIALTRFVDVNIARHILRETYPFGLSRS
jgi:hypothetical protein